MEIKERERVSVETTIKAPIEKVWDFWTNPIHIVHWNNAAADWHTPKAENDLKVGGKFVFKMAAKDGTFGFEFEGVYTEVKNNELIAYQMGDGRNAKINFTSDADKIKITETFEIEDNNTIDLQRIGWQAILNNFKKYVEAN